MSNDSRDIGYAVFFFGFGIWSFFHGFNRLRRKRLIEDIPTSTVRGLALGLVEVNGKAKSVTLLESPLTKTRCVLYMYKVEEYRRSNKHGHWVTIAKGDSFLRPFCLDDATGEVMVLPKDAEFFFPVDYKFSTGLGRSLPENLIEFMENSNIGYRTWLGFRQLRFREWFICEGESVYVLGTAQKKNDEISQDYKNKLMQRIEELKSNPQKTKEIDQDNDGETSLQEWDTAVAKIESQLLDDTLKNSTIDNASDIIIAKGDAEKIFMISDYSQDSLIRKLSWECFSYIYGGAALSLAMLVYLVFRFRIF